MSKPKGQWRIQLRHREGDQCVSPQGAARASGSERGGHESECRTGHSPWKLHNPTLWSAAWSPEARQPLNHCLLAQQEAGALVAGSGRLRLSPASKGGFGTSGEGAAGCSGWWGEATLGLGSGFVGQAWSIWGAYRGEHFRGDLGLDRDQQTRT